MSDATVGSGSLRKSIRTALTITGVLALLAGIAILIWPGKSAVVVTAIIAAYLIVAGVVYLGLGFFSPAGGGWARVGHILLGLLYIVAGIVGFVYLPATTATLAAFVAILIGVSWIVDGFVSFSLLGTATSRGWTIFYAVISIIAGIIVLFSPMLAAATLWWLLGIALVAIGVFQLVRAATTSSAGV